MRAPKHLWSGDWERESAAVSEDLAALEELPRVAPAPRPGDRAQPQPVPASERPSPGAVSDHSRRGTAPTTRRESPARPARSPRPPRTARAISLLRHRLPSMSPRARRVTMVTVTVLLALAAASYGLGALLGSTGSHSTAAASGSSPAISWLGMEVETVSPGQVVVATVASGSAGEQAGFEPGDVVVAIDSRSISSTTDIGKAIFGMQAGDQVQVEVGRGSTLFVTAATLGAPPAKYP
jgi:PDZ domain